jgi:RNA polymerase sigma-70 factor (ECF subfamily)
VVEGVAVSAKVNDGDLIRRSIVDGRLFERVFDRHHAVIHRFLRARVGSEAADDLASEVFTTAFRRREAYDTRWPDARPWLFGIAVNLLRAHRQTEERRLRAYARAGAELGSNAGEPDGHAEAFDGRGDISRALLSLTERDRDLILLLAWGDLSYEQLGAALGIPVGTVRSRISRIRGVLRERLEAPAGTAVQAGGSDG